MQTIIKVLIAPVCFGLLITWSIFGLDKGSSVYDDYAWIIGVIVAIGGIYQAHQLMTMQNRIEKLENSPQNKKII